MQFTKGTQMFDDLQFVIKAVNLKDLRENLRCLHATDKFIEATDGHRLHRLNEPFFEPGLYRAIKATKGEIYLVPDKEGLEFPDTDRIWPKDIPELKQLEINEDKVVQLSLNFTQIVRASEKNTVNVNYLKDVISSGGFWSFAWTGNFTPVVFQSGNKTALLMSMKTE